MTTIIAYTVQNALPIYPTDFPQKTYKGRYYYFQSTDLKEEEKLKYRENKEFSQDNRVRKCQS